MGIKDLWGFLEPFCEKKPLFEFSGKVVAIDLAGWVCESLNIVDYQIQPKMYLKHLFFRTSYLLLSNITPVFILEGEAPQLKYDVIAKRNEIQFPGARIRSQKEPGTQTQKGRTRFNYVLKQCQELLLCMGVKCVKGDGEAEAYGAFLNAEGFIDGIISQDSDCFAYGAITVLRNFSVAANQGGVVDVYSMEKVRHHIDFGQNKIIAMALLCGCDYCPGVEGVGKDAVKKLFLNYNNCDILEELRKWRQNEKKFLDMEKLVEDKNKCNNCGHYGKTASHTRKGCGLCGTSTGCDASKWREERLRIKSELSIRDKSIKDPSFPSEDIIEEFTKKQRITEELDLVWKPPNIVKFVKIMGKLLEWEEIYAFEKILPLFTRWILLSFKSKEQIDSRGTLVPSYIKKKRNPKGVPSYEIIWKDASNCFGGLIPDEQFERFVSENPGGVDTLWTTIEPIPLVENSFPLVVDLFIASKLKPLKKPRNPRKKKHKPTGETPIDPQKKPKANDSLKDFSGMASALNEISENIPKKVSAPKARRKGLVPVGVKKIDEFFKNEVVEVHNISDASLLQDCPLLNDTRNDSAELSAIINGIVSQSPILKGNFEELKINFRQVNEKRVKDLDCLQEKENFLEEVEKTKNINIHSPRAKDEDLDDIDLLIMRKPHRRKKTQELLNSSTPNRK